MANHHSRNHRAWKKQYKAKLAARVLAAKIARGSCVDCGLEINDENHVAFDFDHRDPGTKRNDIRSLIVNESWSTLVVEMDKCDLRCSNCHRIRTWRERHWASDDGAPDVDKHPSLWDVA